MTSPKALGSTNVSTYSYLSIATLALAFALFVPAAFAVDPPPEMCGDGTTFTVILPGNLPNSVTLPNGCRIYALLVSGYAINPKLDQLSFYKLAKFVAENNGYVHYAWWNNLLGEYLSQPLHDSSAHPGSLEDTHILGFIPKNFPAVMTSVLKAVPEEDFQFQADAKLFLKAIRANNPDAIIVVAGHSMGGNAVARLSAEPDVPIDLLAPIDPVGNRSQPVGQLPPVGLITQTFNWNRWRVANDLLGYRQRDCVRNSFGLCRDFDPRLFYVAFRCTVGPLLSTSPGIGSRAPLVCPQLLPIVVTGPRPTIGANVRYLYNRWQKEFVFPFDFFDDEPLSRPGPLTGLLGGNYQTPVLKNGVGEHDRNKTCGVAGILDVGLLAILALDTTFVLPAIGIQPGTPRDPNINCNPTDGHGEIVGIYTQGASPVPYATEAQDWPCSTAIIPLGDFGPNCDSDPSKDAETRRIFRRQLLVEMATTPFPDPNKTIVNLPNWPHEPKNPNLDMVVDDLIVLTNHILADQPGGDDMTPPVTVSSLNPESNGSGWNREDVVVGLSATDTGGSGVKEVQTSLTRAQPGGMVTPGSTAQETVSVEGATTISFFARDNAGNEETPSELLINLDKTPPEVEAVPSPEPNASGWNNTDVTVSFIASDLLSGLAEVTPMNPVLVTSEGADQEILGTATDLADNQSAAAALVSLDKTAPVVIPSPDRSPDSSGWYKHQLTVTWDCSDPLSGVQSFDSPSDYSGPDSASTSVSGSCYDFAENLGTVNFDFQFDATPPAISITTPPDGAVYLLNEVVKAGYQCTDALSGVESCVGPVANDSPIDTATAGDKQFAVDSSDVAGNQANQTRGYSVRYVFSGFAAPIKSDGNAARAGSTVPVKFSLQDANGEFISDFGSLLWLTSSPCDASEPSVPVETAGGSKPRIAAHEFVFNWQTSKSWNGCRSLRLTLADGTEYVVLFQFD